MQLVEKHIINDKSYKDLTIKAKNLYNKSLYYWRQSIFGKIEYFTEYELTGLFAEFNENSYRELPAQTSQQIIKNLFKNIKSWQKSISEYNKTPYKFLGRPKLPKYKKETSIIFFTRQQIKLKDGFIHFPKMTNIKPLKTKVDNVCQVRIVPNSNSFKVEVVYEKKEAKQKEFNGNWLGIDLGLNNLASCSSNNNMFILNGKPLKSINNFYNKKKRKLQSKLKDKTFTSKRIERLTLKRNNKVEDYIHKVSCKIIEESINENITEIIIGNNKNWKQKINIGTLNNRNFVSIPHSALIEKIKYKGYLEGIKIIITQESYTSKCSALDLEPICKHETYAGKRVKRGLFITNSGLKINADINGSLNIARLVAGNEIISDSVRRCVLRPRIVNVF